MNLLVVVVVAIERHCNPFAFFLPPPASSPAKRRAGMLRYCDSEASGSECRCGWVVADRKNVIATTGLTLIQSSGRNKTRKKYRNIDVIDKSRNQLPFQQRALPIDSICMTAWLAPWRSVIVCLFQHD